MIPAGPGMQDELPEARSEKKNHMIPYQDTCIRFRKTIMMHLATGPTHQNAGGVFIGTAYDRRAIEHKV
jgi:hypothetical protein